MEKVIKFIKKYYIAFIIIALSFVIDRVTKEIVYKNETSIEVIKNFFYIDFVMNPGAAFSILVGKRAFFIIITVIAIGVFIYFMKDVDFKKNFFYSLGISLLFGGCIGNFYDRLVYGKVIDFLSFRLGFSFMEYFPTFNVADSCMVIGLISMIVFLIFFTDKSTLFTKKKKEEITTEPIEENNQEEKDNQ